MRILFLLTFLISSQLITAQGRGWWTMDDWGLTYKLPKDFRADPFSSSSVCHCPGTIVDNGEWDDDKYIGLVIYPIPENVEEHDGEDADRGQVWGYTFIPDGKDEKAQFGEIKYVLERGTFSDMDYENEAIRLTSQGKQKASHPDLIIYYWGSPAAFDKHFADIEKILGTIKLEKMK